jgi:hypothetical protein
MHVAFYEKVKIFIACVRTFRCNSLNTHIWEFDELQMWVLIEKIVDQNVKYFFIIQI